MLAAHGEPDRAEGGQDQDGPDRQEPGLGGLELAPRLPSGLVEERCRLARVEGAAVAGGGVGCGVHDVSLVSTLCHKVDGTLWRKVKGFAVELYAVKWRVGALLAALEAIRMGRRIPASAGGRKRPSMPLPATTSSKRPDDIRCQ